MNIPEIDQQLATIKAVEIQNRNGYHISWSDYKQFLDAVIAVQELQQKVKKDNRERKQ